MPALWDAPDAPVRVLGVFFSFLLSGFRSVSVLLCLTWTVSFGVSYLVGLVSASVLSWTVSVGVSSFQCVVSFFLDCFYWWFLVS